MRGVGIDREMEREKMVDLYMNSLQGYMKLSIFKPSQYITHLTLALFLHFLFRYLHPPFRLTQLEHQSDLELERFLQL